MGPRCINLEAKNEGYTLSCTDYHTDTPKTEHVIKMSEDDKKYVAKQLETNPDQYQLIDPRNNKTLEKTIALDEVKVLYSCHSIAIRQEHTYFCLDSVIHENTCDGSE